MIDRSLHGDYAGFFSRAAGLAIDAAISAASITVTSWFLITVLGLFGIDVIHCQPGLSASWSAFICGISSLGLVAFAALFFPLYLVLFWTLAGETPGMRIMGVRVVRSDGRRLSLWTALKRLFGYFVCFFTLGLGFLWVLLDDQRQGLHDILAGTVVIYSWDARLRARFIQRMQRTALRAKMTAQVARDLGADAWAGKDYYVVVLTAADAALLQQLSDQLIAWYQQRPPQVLVAVRLTRDDVGRISIVEVPEILPPTSVVLASNPSIPRQGEVRNEVYRVVNTLPEDRSALVAVIDQPLISEMVQVASDTDISIYKSGWAKVKTAVAVPVEPPAAPTGPVQNSDPVRTATSVGSTPMAAAIVPAAGHAASAADPRVVTSAEPYDPGI